MKLKLFEVVTDMDKIDISFINKVLEGRDAIKDWAYILHDKEDTRAHYHIAVRLKDSYDTKYIAEWFCVAENFVGKVKGRWSDMLKYLIHENAPEKYQYSIDDVISNFDWIVEKDKNGDSRKNDIIMDIVEGKIREFNYTEYISAIEHDKYKKSIDNAFRYRLDKIKGVSRNMNCIYIMGDSGVGKTTYAKQIAENNGYSVYISSGSNDVLDDYKGEDCIILDDLRPSSLGLSDLLKMLDNHTASTVKSRYRNKVLECRMIIITTTLNIDKFFNNVFKEEPETSVQLKRRCETIIRMDRDKLYMKLWIPGKNTYGKEFVMDNPIAFIYGKEDMSSEQALEKLVNILGVTKEMITEVKDNIEDYKQIEMKETPFDKK